MPGTPPLCPIVCRQACRHRPPYSPLPRRREGTSSPPTTASLLVFSSRKALSEIVYTPERQVMWHDGESIRCADVEHPTWGHASGERHPSRASGWRLVPIAAGAAANPGTSLPPRRPRSLTASPPPCGQRRHVHVAQVPVSGFSAPAAAPPWLHALSLVRQASPTPLHPMLCRKHCINPAPLCAGVAAATSACLAVRQEKAGGARFVVAEWHNEQARLLPGQGSATSML